MAPPVPPVIIDIGNDGWFPAQLTPTMTPYRWADTADGGPAELLLFNLSQERRRVTVQMTVQNYAQPRTMNVAINGYALDRFTLANRETHPLSMEVEVPPGMSKLTLSSPEPPVPVQESGAKDNRLLSFSVQGVRLNG